MEGEEEELEETVVVELVEVLVLQVQMSCFDQKLKKAYCQRFLAKLHDGTELVMVTGFSRSLEGAYLDDAFELSSKVLGSQDELELYLWHKVLSLTLMCGDAWEWPETVIFDVFGELMGRVIFHVLLLNVLAFFHVLQQGEPVEMKLH